MSKKFFMVFQFNAGQTPGSPSNCFADKQGAVDQAKRMMANNQKSGYNYDYYVLEAQHMVKVPVPEAEVIDIK